MSMKSGVWLIAFACLAIAVFASRTAAGEDYFDTPDFSTDDGWYEESITSPPSGETYGETYSEPYGEPYADDAPPSFESGVAGPQAGGTMVVAIDVTDTVTTTPDQVRYRMSTRVGHPLNEATLDGDFQRLAAMGVFDDIQIKKEFVDGGVKIIVAVREKDIIRRIDFRGNRQIKNRKLGSLIESKVGERFDVGKGNRDRLAIQDYLNKEYYYFGEVQMDVEPFEDGIRLVFEVQEGGRLYVADIQFRGNTVFNRKQLLAKMETKRSGLISRGKYLRRAFERDLERIRMSYLDKGYLDVRVIERPFQITANVPKSRWQRRDAYIHIDIEEGEQYRVGRVNFDFLASSLVSEEKIRGVIKTMPGEVYSPITLQEDAIKIRDVYGSFPNSRYFTRVMPEPEITEDGLVMDVTFNILESPEVTVEGVRITGLTHTKEVVVLREFELFPGEKVDSRRFNRSKENIENLGYFKERPAIEIREGSAPDRAIVAVELEEIPTGRVSAGVGVSSEDSVMGTLGISQRNFDYKDLPKSFRDLYTGQSFRGAGQSFSAQVSVGSETQRYSVNFTNPWIFGKPISMSLGAYLNKYEYDDEYHEQRVGATLVFGKRLFDIRELTISGGYRLEQVKLSKFNTNYYSHEYTRQKGSHNVSRWIMGIEYDSRDSTFEPTRGLLASANFELAGRPAASSKDFWRAFFTAQYFVPFFVDSQDRNWSLGFRVDAAFADAYGRGDGKDGKNNKDYSGEVPYYERFHLGGVGSLRGYDSRGVSPRDYYNQAIGGEGMVSASVEAFFPIWDRMIRGSVYYDVGTVWRYLDDPTYNSSRDKLGYSASNMDSKFRSAAGFGVHIKTPLGPMPVRLYYSIPLNKRKGDDTQRFQFSMGALF